MVDAGELGAVEIGADDVIVTEQPRSGWAVEAASGETVALDLTITDELRRSGLIRDVVRLLQDTRKSTGLSISDRIDVWWSTDDADLAEALRTQGRAVADEVLAVSSPRAAPTAFPLTATPNWA